jgi:hypothetical protein
MARNHVEYLQLAQFHGRPCFRFCVYAANGEINKAARSPSGAAAIPDKPANAKNP